MKITVIPHGGLCNRLNNILSAISYIRLHPQDELQMYWVANSECNSPLGDLFLPIPGVTLFEQARERLLLAIPKKRLLFIPQLLREFVFDYQFTDRDNSDDFEKIVSGCRNVFVCHTNRFWKYPDEGRCMTSDVFVPRPEIQAEINRVCSVFENRNSVGLHIRRTDNDSSIGHSPIAVFEKKIEDELSSDPDSVFYLATDDTDVKAHFRSLYGDKIVSPDFELRRDSQNGIRDAVIDLYCLGKTDKIYGSFASTYSTFAASLYHRPIEIIDVQ